MRNISFKVAPFAFVARADVGGGGGSGDGNGNE